MRSSSFDISAVEAQALDQGIPFEEIEYVWEEYEQQIEAVDLILPPGIRSATEMEDLAAQARENPLIWTPENEHFFEN